MARILLILSLIVAEIIVSFLKPVELSTDMLTALSDFFGYLFLWDGIFPVFTLVQILVILVIFEISSALYHIFKWLLGNA